MATADKAQEVIEHENVPNSPSEPMKVEIDTKHGDEALKVIAGYTGPAEWEPLEEKKLRRKLDKRLLPILMVTYALQYYDKGMISVAAIFGMLEDIDLSGNRYSMAAAIFFLGFIAGVYPASQLAQRYPVERVAGGLVLLWGICFILTAACTTYQGLYAQRFFLGALEAGISPIFMLVVGQFYRKDEQALMMGVWYSASSFISFVGFPITYGLAHIKGHLKPWKYMYLFGGAITILWAFVIYFLLPPDPIRAKGLSERERYIAVARLRMNNAGVRNLHFKKAHAFELLRDEKFWLVMTMGYLSMIGAAPVTAFAPIIVAGGFKVGVFRTILYLAPAGVFVGMVMIGTTYLAYKVKNIRCIIIFCAQMVTTLAAILLWKLPLTKRSLGGLLFACYILPGFSVGWGLLMGLSIANAAGYTKRVISSSGIYLGYCLGNMTKLLKVHHDCQFTGPLLFRDKDAPRYRPGFEAVVGTAATAGGLSLVYLSICVWQNKRRDALGKAEAFDHAFEDDVTDKKNPQFRYVY